MTTLQFREQKKNNGLLLVAASRGYLADVSLCVVAAAAAAGRSAVFCRKPLLVGVSALPSMFSPAVRGVLAAPYPELIAKVMPKRFRWRCC